MKPLVSLGKVIREMDSRELEDFLLNVWTYKFNKNTSRFLYEYKPIIDKCSVYYKQITNKDLISKLNKEFIK